MQLALLINFLLSFVGAIIIPNPELIELINHITTKDNNHQNVLVSSSDPVEAQLSQFDHLTLFRATFPTIEPFLEQLKVKTLNYVIVFSEISALNITLNAIWKYEAYTPESRYFAITAADDRSTAFGLRIAEAFWALKMVHVYVAFNDSPQIYSVDVSDCGNAAHISTAPRIDLKTAFVNCPIHVIEGIAPPYINPKNDSIKGIFNELVLVLGEAGQRPISYRPYDSIYLDELLQAYSIASLVDAFSMDYADLFLSTLPQMVYDQVDLSPKLLSSDLMFLVPREFINGATDVLYSSLSGRPEAIAIMFLVQLTIVGLFYSIVRRTDDIRIFEDFTKSWFILFGITLNMPVFSGTPRNKTVRILIATLLISSMLSTFLLQGVLISISNGPFYEPPMKTVEQLLETNIPIKVFPALGLLFKDKTNELHRRITQKLVFVESTDVTEIGSTLLRDRNYATITYSGFLILKSNIESSFSAVVCLPNELYIAMPKNYYLRTQFGRWFEWMLQHGFVVKFERQSRFKYALRSYVETQTRDNVLTLEQFQPVVILTVIGWLTAIGVFVLEVSLFHFRTLIMKYYNALFKRF